MGSSKNITFKQENGLCPWLEYGEWHYYIQDKKNTHKHIDDYTRLTAKAWLYQLMRRKKGIEYLNIPRLESEIVDYAKKEFQENKDHFQRRLEEIIIDKLGEGKINSHNINTTHVRYGYNSFVSGLEIIGRYRVGLFNLETCKGRIIHIAEFCTREFELFEDCKKVSIDWILKNSDCHIKD